MLNEIQQEVESLPHSQSINPMLHHSGDVPELLPTDQWTLEEVRLEFLWPSLHSITCMSKTNLNKKIVAMLQTPPTYSVLVPVVNP